jgi:rubredoxin
MARGTTKGRKYYRESKISCPECSTGKVEILMRREKGKPIRQRCVTCGWRYPRPKPNYTPSIDGNRRVSEVPARHRPEATPMRMCRAMMVGGEGFDVE